MHSVILCCDLIPVTITTISIVRHLSAAVTIAMLFAANAIIIVLTIHITITFT